MRTLTLFSGSMFSQQRQRLRMRNVTLDTSAFDRSVRAQDDLFEHVNGTWLKEHRNSSGQIELRFVHSAGRLVAGTYSRFGSRGRQSESRTR